jgi:hypothetical protein
MVMSDDELRGPLQNYEIFSQQQPHDVTYSIPLDEHRSFQVTIAIVEKRAGRSFLDNYYVRRASIAELQAGIARFASLPIRESARHG